MAELITRHSLLAVLSRHIGAANGVSATRLVAEITGVAVRDAACERYLREIIVKLRLDGYHVCAWPEAGYFMAADEEELNRQCYWLHDRAMTSLLQVAAMKRVALPDLRGQLRLPT